MIGNGPLVSVLVMTYNSSGFVLETLESIKDQTYKNIELIVTDDGSSDNTVGMCRDWLAQNTGRFAAVKLVLSEQNSGVSGNCNRGLAAVSGEWVKYIAGDDALLPDCVELNLDFALTNDAVMVHSDRLVYERTFDDENFKRRTSLTGHIMGDAEVGSDAQFQFLLRDNVIGAPTSFIRTDILQKLGGFDERIPMIEDWPLWIKLTRGGYKLWYLNKPTVKYRVYETSLSGRKGGRLLSELEFRVQPVYEFYIYPQVNSLERFLCKYNFKRKVFFRRIGLDRNASICVFLDRITAYPATKYRYRKINSIKRC